MYGRRNAETAQLKPPPPSKRLASTSTKKNPAIHHCASDGTGCTITGDYHTWTFKCRRGTFRHACDDACELAVPDVATYVCPVSGRCFERILNRTTYSSTTNAAESYIVPTFSKSPATAAANALASPVGSSTLATTTTTTTSSASSGGVEAHRKVVGTGGKMKSIHLTDVVPILRVLFSRGDWSPFPFESVVAAYASELVRLYEFDKGTNLVLHVVGTLYFLKKGITVGKTCVCPPDPFLARVLPTSHDLPALSPLFQRAFITDGNKIWIDVLGSVASRDKGVMRRAARNVQGKRLLLQRTKMEAKRRRRRNRRKRQFPSLPSVPPPTTSSSSVSFLNRFGFGDGGGGDDDEDDDDGMMVDDDSDDDDDDDDGDDDWEEGNDYSATDMSAKAWNEFSVFRTHDEIVRASEVKRGYRESRMVEL